MSEDLAVTKLLLPPSGVKKRETFPLDRINQITARLLPGFPFHRYQLPLEGRPPNAQSLSSFIPSQQVCGEHCDADVAVVSRALKVQPDYGKPTAGVPDSWLDRSSPVFVVASPGR